MQCRRNGAIGSISNRLLAKTRQALGQDGLEVFSARIAGTVDERPRLCLGPIPPFIGSIIARVAVQRILPPPRYAVRSACDSLFAAALPQSPVNEPQAATAGLIARTRTGGRGQ